MNYERQNISKITGYIPGEQPQDRKYIKLNTNENPYPAAPAVAQTLAKLNPNHLNRYPDPVALKLRQTAAKQTNLNNIDSNWLLAGNGSDDLLTIAVRTFVDQNATIAYPDPSYSLYPVLANIQGAKHTQIPLTPQFTLPTDTLQQAQGASLLFIARPNAPTGNTFPKEQMHNICKNFQGIVWIDEAYADFADDNCLKLIKQYPNTIVSRTLSKSYSLAGIRVGLAYANPNLITQMQKVKDSYNINTISQQLAIAAIKEHTYMQQNCKKIQQTREQTSQQLKKLNFKVFPSQANFLFVQPPIPAPQLLKKLKTKGFLVRHFKQANISQYLRISIGTQQEMKQFIQATQQILHQN